MSSWNPNGECSLPAGTTFGVDLAPIGKVAEMEDDRHFPPGQVCGLKINRILHGMLVVPRFCPIPSLPMMMSFVHITNVKVFCKHVRFNLKSAGQTDLPGPCPVHEAAWERRKHYIEDEGKSL
jgi:hypothetical protein